MKIEEICSRQPVHIPSSRTLQDAAMQMRDKHVGALIVTEAAPAGERAIGMLTDRDIALNATASGHDPSETAVADVMTPGLVSIAGKDNVSDALQAMLSHGVRRLAVLDGEAVVGVVSLDDIMGALAADWNMLAALIRNEQDRERAGNVQSTLRV
ncbi:CBS domain-containing protein [Pandoraea pnomenusa]|uniref:Hypoxic response protein 1 n=2 Tax=Pandoraea pnomenusa TaxID=93220 RepID=A0A378YC26_9BURK|nr:CBS domain-containing protein [Pandoraea pnomenusa]AHB05970.1 signal transduction protein [Pandoraea pnomenusa 3kgm]AHN73746.1 signal transduction protein [Pandoraea pnomenusa]AIU25505.1 signal transduction protein [Pandoraea pnomenusa]ANC46635.1 signal transduction protein [Pandoraea pnomenusa]QDH59868.1 CBS domain-containing protein [Pandoraea pnomenusa]